MTALAVTVPAGGAPAVRRTPVDPRLWRRARAFRWWVAGSVAIGVATTAGLVAQATFLARAVAAVMAGGSSVASVRHDLAGLALATLGRALLAFLGEQAATGAAGRTKSELRAAGMRTLAATGPAELAQHRTGDLAVTFGHGLDALDGYLGRYLPRLVLAFLAPVVLLGWIAHLDLLSAGILAVTLVLLPVFMVLVGQLTEARVAARWSSLAALSGQFLDAVEGLATLRAFGRVRAQRSTIARASDELREATLGTLKVALLSALVLETLAAVGTALVAVPLGLRLLSGEILLAPAVTILVLTPEVYLPLRRASAEFHASTDGLAALDAVFAVLEGEHPAASSPPGTVVRAVEGPPAIELQQVVVRHRDRRGAALGPIDLTIAPGEHLGVVGPSGAGKTTLVDLLAGLTRPESGRVVLGGRCSPGVDLAEVDPAEWRARLAWVPQRPTLFAGTVADNLRLGAPEASERELWEVLEAACLAEVVAALPGGLRTELGEHAETLSAGERQRLAIARALARRGADLVLLDEPSAHLDPATEAELVARLGSVLEGRSLLVVTHRPRPLELAHRVVALEAGRVRQPAGAGAGQVAAG